MSVTKREGAQCAKDHLTNAERSARRARKLFEDIGDPEGAKQAGEAEKASSGAKRYVERRLGKDEN